MLRLEEACASFSLKTLGHPTGKAVGNNPGNTTRSSIQILREELTNHIKFYYFKNL
jgi:hypothetical protein